jgi:hypothetical protein
MTPEDEAFNEIERQAKQRKEAVLQALHDENERIGLYKDAYGTTKERLMAEVTVLTELVRVLSDRVAELEGASNTLNEMRRRYDDHFAKALGVVAKEKNNG